jgi:hypothetical protein
MKKLFLLVVTISGLAAQAPAPPPDTIIFTNGDKLVGHLVSSTGTSVTFSSDAIGNITVDWSKIKELHTSGKFAVVEKGVQLGKHENPSKIPQGTLSVTDQNIQVTPAAGQPPQTIPVANSAFIVDQSSFNTAVMNIPGLLEYWKGTVTAGGSLVNATQSSYAFNGAIALVRAIPTESWLNPRNRTTFDFSTSYGEEMQPNTPTIRTSIYHLDAERDEYFTRSVYGFGELAYDHNFSQGLVLQQNYGGGVGWTALKDANQTLDLKGSITYIKQQFQGTTPSMNLIGSIFDEHYNRKFKRVVLDQHLTATPAWNNTNAYSAAGSLMLTVPVYKQLGATTGVIETFLNDPPPGFKKNSLQATMGLTYTLP